MGDLSVIFGGMAVNKKRPLHLTVYANKARMLYVDDIYIGVDAAHTRVPILWTPGHRRLLADPHCYIRAKFGASTGNTPLQVKTFAVNRCS